MLQKTALIVIDMQRKYMDKYDSGLIERVNSRILKAKDQEEPVIYVKNVGLSGSEGYELDDGLLLVSDYVFEKRFPSAFSADEFVLVLDKLKVSELELIGVDGSSCVAKTAFEAKENGYEVCVNLTCVASINEKIFSDTVQKMEKAEPPESILYLRLA